MARTSCRGQWTRLSWIPSGRTRRSSRNSFARSLVWKDWGTYGRMCLDLKMESDIGLGVCLYISWSIRWNCERPQAHMPLCIRYLAGCKYVEVPGRWETCQCIFGWDEEYSLLAYILLVGMRIIYIFFFLNSGDGISASSPSREYIETWEVGHLMERTHMSK